MLDDIGKEPTIRRYPIIQECNKVSRRLQSSRMECSEYPQHEAIENVPNKFAEKLSFKMQIQSNDMQGPS